MNATPSTPSSDVPERIAQLIWALCQTVSMRFSFRVRTLTREQVEYICGRLLAARKRFRHVVERIRAGKPPKPRARKKPRARRVTPKLEPLSDAEINSGFPPPPGWKRWAREDRAAERRAARERAALERAAEAAKPLPLWRTLRQHLFGWLCGCAPAIYELPGSAAAHADEMRRLLGEPEMRALLMSHRAVGDSLRKVCWGLGVEPSLLYPEPSIPSAPAVAAAGISDPAPAKTESAMPLIVAIVVPDETRCSVTVTPPPAVAGEMPSSRALPDLPAKEHEFFAAG